MKKTEANTERIDNDAKDTLEDGRGSPKDRDKPITEGDELIVLTGGRIFQTMWMLIKRKIRLIIQKCLKEEEEGYMACLIQIKGDQLREF